MGFLMVAQDLAGGFPVIVTLQISVVDKEDVKKVSLFSSYVDKHLTIGYCEQCFVFIINTSPFWLYYCNKSMVGCIFCTPRD